MDLDDLVARVIRLRADRVDRVMIGIAGCPGAGKTTLAERLVAALAVRLGADAVAHVPMDGFHLADVQLDRLGLRERKGAPASFDAGGYLALLHRLRHDDEPVVYAPGFERTLEQPIAGSVAVPASARVVVTEGNYLLLDGEWSGVRAVLDEVWFCHLDEPTRRRRLVDRHVRFGKSPEAADLWTTTVDDPNAQLVAATRHLADLVVHSD